LTRGVPPWLYSGTNVHSPQCHLLPYSSHKPSSLVRVTFPFATPSTTLCPLTLLGLPLSASPLCDLICCLKPVPCLCALFSCHDLLVPYLVATIVILFFFFFYIFTSSPRDTIPYAGSGGDLAFGTLVVLGSNSFLRHFHCIGLSFYTICTCLSLNEQSR
jgi:hypothetical protein